MNYKSLLFVPAKEKMLSKIANFSADAYIIDLEDSISPKEKELALYQTIEYLNSTDIDAGLFVRVNNEYILKELSALDSFSKLGFMLPKIENISIYKNIQGILERHFIIGLVETPVGLISIQEIAACEWIDALAFGAEDYTAKACMKNSMEFLSYQKGMLLTYAKANNKKIYDTPSFQIKNKKIFEEEVQSSVDLGFDGKLAINPKHIESINKAFNSYEIELIKNIIKIYEKEAKAVAVIDGKVYEKMHIDRLKRILKENEEK